MGSKECVFLDKHELPENFLIASFLIAVALIIILWHSIPFFFIRAPILLPVFHVTTFHIHIWNVNNVHF